jgi:hypothetical protein
MSMPDETLHSRITRYHFLSGNRTEAETFRDLFGSDPFGVGMLPKKIEVLAGREISKSSSAATPRFPHTGLFSA